MDHAYQLLEALMFGQLEAQVGRARLASAVHATAPFKEEEAGEAEAQLETLADLADGACALAQERHEARLLAEARAIAAGDLAMAPTPEHLRLLLGQLERVSAPAALKQAPF